MNIAWRLLQSTITNLMSLNVYLHAFSKFDSSVWESQQQRKLKGKRSENSFLKSFCSNISEEMTEDCENFYHSFKVENHTCLKKTVIQILQTKPL
jgi:hypothetical protein